MLFTARELEFQKQKMPQQKIEALSVKKPQSWVRCVFRMFHPDSTDRNPISCAFKLSGETIKLVRGIAEVPDDLVPVLLKSGYLLGKKVDKEWINKEEA